MASVAGHALLFASDFSPDASAPLAHAWHKGCPVLRGEKRMLTKFKARRVSPRDAEAEHRAAWEAL